MLTASARRESMSKSVAAALSSFSEQLPSQLAQGNDAPLPAIGTKTPGSAGAPLRPSSARIRRFGHGCRESAWSSIHAHVRCGVQKEPLPWSCWDGCGCGCGCGCVGCRRCWQKMAVGWWWSTFSFFSSSFWRRSIRRFDWWMLRL